MANEARANAAEGSLAEAKARIAQLEDELSVSQSDALAAASKVKPPVNIDTGTHINSAGGAVALPSAATGNGLAILAAVLGVVGLIAVFVKRKGK